MSIEGARKMVAGRVTVTAVIWEVEEDRMMVVFVWGWGWGSVPL